MNPCLEQTRIDAAKTGGSRKEEQTTSGRRRRRSRLRSELNQYPSLNTHRSYNFESGNRQTAPRFFDATETLISCSRSRVSKTQSTQFIAFRFFSCRKGELVDLMVVSPPTWLPLEIRATFPTVDLQKPKKNSFTLAHCSAFIQCIYIASIEYRFIRSY